MNVWMYDFANHYRITDPIALAMRAMVTNLTLFRLPHLTPKTTRRAAAPHLTPQTAREADSPLVCVLGTCSPKHGRNRRQAAELGRAQLKKALTLDRKGVCVVASSAPAYRLSAAGAPSESDSAARASSRARSPQRINTI